MRESAKNVSTRHSTPTAEMPHAVIMAQPLPPPTACAPESVKTPAPMMSVITAVTRRNNPSFPCSSAAAPLPALPAMPAPAVCAMPAPPPFADSMGKSPFLNVRPGRPLTLPHPSTSGTDDPSIVGHDTPSWGQMRAFYATFRILLPFVYGFLEKYSCVNVNLPNCAPSSRTAESASLSALPRVHKWRVSRNFPQKPPLVHWAIRRTTGGDGAAKATPRRCAPG